MESEVDPPSTGSATTARVKHHSEVAYLTVHLGRLANIVVCLLSCKIEQLLFLVGHANKRADDSEAGRKRVRVRRSARAPKTNQKKKMLLLHNYSLGILADLAFGENTGREEHANRNGGRRGLGSGT